MEYLKSKDADLRRTVAEPRDKPDSSKEKEEESCNKNSESEEETKLTEENELLSSDMRREILRRQWEKEEDALRDKHDIHYQDVLFNGKIYTKKCVFRLGHDFLSLQRHVRMALATTASQRTKK